MTKSKLKNGAIVECRNGFRYIKIDNTLLDKNGRFLDLREYDETLKCIRNPYYNINKVNNSVETNCEALWNVTHHNEWTWERPIEILNKKEKEYFSAVIKPFRDKIEFICKHNTDFITQEYIKIGLIDDDNAVLPYFEQNTMYKDMKLNKEYTLEELGL